MKNRILHQLLSLVFSLFFLLTSCIDDSYKIDDIDTTVGLDMALVGPIGKSKITLSSVFPDDLENYELLIRNDSIFIVLHDTVDFGSTFIDDIKIPKGKYTKHIPVIDSNLLPTTSVDVDVTLDYEFDINTNPNERIDSLVFNTSVLNFQFTSNYDYSPAAQMEVIFDSDELVLNPTLYPENKIVLSLVQGTINQNIDLTGAKLFFPNSSKKIKIRYKVHVETNTPFVPGTEPIDVAIDFDTTIPRIVYGYIGQNRDIWGGEIVRPFDFTSLFQGVDFFLPFYNPQIYITAESNIGIPAQYTLDWVKATDTNTSEVVYADFEGSPNTSFVLNYPVISEIENKSIQELLSFDSRILDKRHTKLFDREYGATNRLFQINANELAYKFSVRTLNDPAASVHYFLNDSKMSLYIKAMIQLNFEGNDNPAKSFHVNLSDTLDIDFAQIIDVDQVDTENEIVARIKLNYKNALPIGAFASLSFLDENKEQVQYNNETLEKEFTIEPAQVKPDGTVLAPLPNTSITINLTADEYTNYISKTKKLAFTYSMKGNDGKNVQIKASDWLELKASFYVSAKAKVTPE